MQHLCMVLAITICRRILRHKQCSAMAIICTLLRMADSMPDLLPQTKDVTGCLYTVRLSAYRVIRMVQSRQKAKIETLLLRFLCRPITDLNSTQKLRATF